jgi:hypothetical protein
VFPFAKVLHGGAQAFFRRLGAMAAGSVAGSSFLFDCGAGSLLRLGPHGAYCRRFLCETAFQGRHQIDHRWRRDDLSGFDGEALQLGFDQPRNASW